MDKEQKEHVTRSISLSKELLAKIDELAAREKRSR